MAEYIEREALMEDCKCMINEMWNSKTAPVSWPHAYAEFLDNVERAPAADVAPVVHGEWETVDWLEYDAQSCEMIRCPEEGIACTRCRYVFKKDALWKRNFCPNCGARMDGDDDAKAD